MKTKHLLALWFAVTLAVVGTVRGQQTAKPSVAQTSAPPKSTAQKPAGTTATKPAVTPAKKSDANASTAAPIATAASQTDASPTELISQGKQLYRTAKFKPALAKFEAALKLEPDNDEALGLAAVTAFRLDNQATSREYFTRRAELPGQKDSVKAYSYYRVALTYWREAHDLVAQYGEISDDRVHYKLPEDGLSRAKDMIQNGLEAAERALALSANFPEAYNVQNLLHAEASLAETSEKRAAEHRTEAWQSLRRAQALAKPAPEGKAAETADFSFPTARISEFARTEEEEATLRDPLRDLLIGGKPIKRVAAKFPSTRPAKPTGNPNDPSGKGVTADGSAVSLGTGRGALTAAYAPGIVKVEVLISTEGKVVFAHVVDGRSDLNGAAILAARGWTFEPAKFEDRPVQISGVITFDLKPPGRAATKP